MWIVVLFASSAGWRCAVLVNWFVNVFDFQMVKKALYRLMRGRTFFFIMYHV